MQGALRLHGLKRHQPPIMIFGVCHIWVIEMYYYMFMVKSSLEQNLSRYHYNTVYYFYNDPNITHTKNWGQPHFDNLMQRLTINDFLLIINCCLAKVEKKYGELSLTAACNNGLQTYLYLSQSLLVSLLVQVDNLKG